METIIKFSSLSPIQRISYINNLNNVQLKLLKISLVKAYEENGLFEAYIGYCNELVSKNRSDLINKLLE